MQGTPMVCRARSAPKYRYFSVRNQFPAMHESGSASVAGELYDLPLKVLRDHLVPAEPAELEIGVIELEDGSAALATVLRDAMVEPLLRSGDIRDISYLGDWRAFLHHEG
ncbi:gamma-glutamylcyclotransferase [Lentzea sp. CC55]|uniref:allophanate hydrolase-related protein n=1 Tax=Lentzea sp. CC55 TaxID=2884909 RepID=UPI0027E0E74A|nr:gamma-glutamylcyclotransferase [Lentzea sp. CC55]